MIFFDVDGTLLNHADAEYQAAIQFAAILDFECTDGEAFVTRWREVSELYMAQFLSGKITFEEQRHMRLQDFLGRKLTRKDAVRIFGEYLSEYEAKWWLYDDVLPCLERLSGPLGIVTNGNREQQVKKLSATLIEKYFDVIVTSEDVGISKPNAGIFEAARSEAAAPVGACTYVGDQLETDAVGAADAGWRSVWLNRESVPDHTPREVEVITSLNQLESHLRY